MSMSEQPAPKGIRWGRVILALSLAMNLLVLGLVGGSALYHSRNGAPPGREILEYGPYTRALSPEDRRALRSALRHDAGAMRSTRREVRQDFERLLQLLRTEPFDVAAAAGLLEAQQARVGEQVELVRRLFLEQISAMEPEERAAFADRLEQVLRHGPPRHAPARD
ncbi:MAG: periplasmic heavy metal sensor [Pseudomonadota bacterium]|jgi:uncharacterized membrane protein|nr:periplasmic heavy metal sensor [Pseudomonadota bacterium]